MTNYNPQEDSTEIWEMLLSRQPEQVLFVFLRLSVSEQRQVLAHLNRMVEEPDWHPEQRASALAALNAISGPAK